MSRNIRALAAECLFNVVDNGRSLNDELPAAQAKLTNDKDKSLLQMICFGVLRWLPTYDFYCSQLLKEPLKGKKRPFQFLLYVGIFQLSQTRIPPHAALSETVDATKALKAPGMKSLVNAILRGFQRRQQELEDLAADKPVLKFAHPNWLIKSLKENYPEQWESVLAANQQQAPMWLRVNTQVQSVDSFTTLLAENDIEFNDQSDEIPETAIQLSSPAPVGKIPAFFDGSCSVQDAAPQFSASLLDPQPGDVVLDACAAPGGKTCHLLEFEPKIASLTALDNDLQRLTRVQENLSRLKLDADIVCADAADTNRWWDKTPFDRILLDAPCSATGVIRRHPDIKWLRKQADIATLAAVQSDILDALWQTLKPGGTLLYATCSILPEENQQQIAAFLKRTPDATLSPINEGETVKKPGWQLLPGEHNMDGFYYARLIKQSN